MASPPLSERRAKAAAAATQRLALSRASPRSPGGESATEAGTPPPKVKPKPEEDEEEEEEEGGEGEGEGDGGIGGTMDDRPPDIDLTMSSDTDSVDTDNTSTAASRRKRRRTEAAAADPSLSPEGRRPTRAVPRPPVSHNLKVVWEGRLDRARRRAAQAEATMRDLRLDIPPNPYDTREADMQERMSTLSQFVTTQDQAAEGGAGAGAGGTGRPAEDSAVVAMRNFFGRDGEAAAAASGDSPLVDFFRGLGDLRGRMAAGDPSRLTRGSRRFVTTVNSLAERQDLGGITPPGFARGHSEGAIDSRLAVAPFVKPTPTPVTRKPKATKRRRREERGGADEESKTDRDPCTVCLEVFKDGEHVATLPCLHRYHNTCIRQWLEHSPTCPVCKANIFAG